MRRIISSLVLAPLVLGGCSSHPETLELDGLTVLVAEERSGSAEQAIVGTLVDVEGCLGLELGENTWIAVFPAGTTVTDDGSALQSNGATFHLGDRLEASGELYSRSDPPEGAPDLPRACGAHQAALLAKPEVAG